MERAHDTADLLEIRDTQDVAAMLRLLQWAELELNAMNAPRTSAMIRQCCETLKAEAGITD